jgi:hypothetical protein
MPVHLTQDPKALRAVGGNCADISIEIACHPQELFMDPSRPDNINERTAK